MMQVLSSDPSNFDSVKTIRAKQRDDVFDLHMTMTVKVGAQASSFRRGPEITRCFPASQAARQ
jgi:hypothetical protein